MIARWDEPTERRILTAKSGNMLGLPSERRMLLAKCRAAIRAFNQYGGHAAEIEVARAEDALQRWDEEHRRQI